MKDHQKTSWDVRTLVFLGALVAMHLVLTRVFVLELGFTRISLGSVCTILAGLWFGPVAGAVVGFTADIVGCFMKGYAVNPLITLAAILWGVIPVLFRPLFLKGSRVKKSMWLCAGVTLASVISSLGLTTAGLVLFNGFNFFAIMPARIIQFCVMTVVYCVITNLLFFSPATNVIQGLQRHKMRSNP